MVDRPVWADSLTHLLTGMSANAPVPLLPSLSIFASGPIRSADLDTYLVSADSNDSTLIQLRLALAAWDSVETASWLEGGAAMSPPRSDARRAEVYRCLQLADSTTAIINEIAPVFVEQSVIISDKYEQWYAEARASRSRLYWSDYKNYLRDVKGWDADAINSLESTTTQVVERLSDPTRAEAKKTKGLVMGYVQSGKTANFTGVIAKAIDSGYRLVIVLTGTIELLRSQTQHRLDMELVGRENIIAGQDIEDPDVLRELDYQQDRAWLQDKFVRHREGLLADGVPAIRRITTHHRDYRRLPQGLTQLRFDRFDKTKELNHPHNLFKADAYLAVVKKERSALDQFLRDLKPLRSQLDHLPVLIIDDESDQASVDTTKPKTATSAEKKKRTAINQRISEIYSTCKRSQYVGYTATPFANVFIDPDDSDDLFPSNFIISLQAPPGYQGVKEFHDVGKRWDDEIKSVANSNELAFVRAIEGDPDSDPEMRDTELVDALDSFVLSGAIKLYRTAHSSRTYDHHTMLVHESVRRADHATTADTVRALWESCGYGTGAGTERLRALFENDFAPVSNAHAGSDEVPSSFDLLEPFVASAVAEITKDNDPVIVVNSDKSVDDNTKRLDFVTENVWRILVGGAQLSRGFTVEGLTVSYFRRKAGQADTLMQAGRWFGFRPGYKDLVRLYIRRDSTVDLYQAFEALLVDEEDFREELRRFEGFDDDGQPLVEPWQVPPLVSQTLPWLRPTARNKMWNAVLNQKGVGGKVQDLYHHPAQDSRALKRANYESVGAHLLDAANSSEVLQTPRSPFDAKVGVLDADLFLRILEPATGMQWNETFKPTFPPIYRFLKNLTEDGRVDRWVVVWPQVGTERQLSAESGIRTVRMVERSRRKDRGDFVGSDAKHRFAPERIAGTSPAPYFPDDVAERWRGDSSTTGAILMYVVDDRREKTGEPVDPGDVAVIFSIVAPRAAATVGAGKIQWSVRRPDEVGVPAVRRD